MKIHFRKISAAIYVLTVAALILSCSGSGGPLAPGVDPSVAGAGVLQDTQGSGAVTQSHYPWGFYLVHINPDEGSWEIEPQRQVATHWNILNFLEVFPCTNCFQLVGFQPSGNGTLLVDVRIRHPFIGKLNFTGFDVRGIAMFDGDKTFPVSGLVKSSSASGDGEVIDPDGFTTLYNPTTEGSGPGGMQGYIKGKFGTLTYPQTTLNPYIRFITDDVANTRNAFYSGDEVTVQYEVKMPTPGSFVFGYAIDACWAPPTIKPVVDPMTDFGPEANCPEPWKIEVEDTPVGPGLTPYGGKTVLTIDVYDWQEGTHVEPVIECPEIFIGAQTAEKIADNGDYSTYQVTVTKTEITTVGFHECLVSVEDDENATAPEWLDLSAYFVHNLEVVEYTISDPVAFAVADPNPQTVCEEVHFTDDGSYDPDGGGIAKFEWDWENDGVFDEEGSDVYHTFPGSGIFEVQLKVTDDENQSAKLIEPLQVTIENILPTAEGSIDKTDVKIGEPITFDGSTSHDNDCGDESIIQWDWDIGGNVYPTTSPEPLILAIHEWGYYDVVLTVTDDEHGTDAIDVPLSFRVHEGWAQTWGGTADDQAFSSVTDSLDNIYVEGSFENTVDFDPSDGTDEHTSNGGSDCFICMYNSDGEFQWAKTWGGTNDDTPRGMAASGDTDLYVVGSFSGDDVDFDPDPVAQELLSSAGMSDAFLVRFDMSGNFVWAWNWGKDNTDFCTDVSVDDGGTIYVSGNFMGTSVDFDPDPSIAGMDVHSSVGLYDAFLVSYLANGDYRWGRTWGSTVNDGANAVCAESSDNVAVCGYFRDTADFDPGAGTVNMISNGEEDAFVSQFSVTGDFEWVASFGDTGTDLGNDVILDSTDKVCLVGSFYGTVDFDPGPDAYQLPSNGLIDAFFVKLTTDGDFVGARTWGGASIDGADAIVEDGSGRMYVSGNFTGDDVDLDPGPGVDLHSSYSSTQDIYIIGFSSAFGFAWARTWGAEGADAAYGLSVFSNTFIYPAGWFSGTIDFDPGDPWADSHTSGGQFDAFLIKMRTDGNW